VEHQYILQRQRNIYSSSDGESHSGQQHSEDRHLLSVEPAERPMMKILMRLRPWTADIVMLPVVIEEEGNREGSVENKWRVLF